MSMNCCHRSQCPDSFASLTALTSYPGRDFEEIAFRVSEVDTPNPPVVQCLGLTHQLDTFAFQLTIRFVNVIQACCNRRPGLFSLSQSKAHIRCIAAYVLQQR